MATKKTVTPDYVLPVGSEWSSPPCPGSIGSKPNLDDVSKQTQEIINAGREGREPQALAVHCGFCQGYHKEMQPPVELLINGEVTMNHPLPEIKDPPVDPELVAVASEAVTNVSNLPVEETTDEIEELLNGDSDKQNSDSGSSGSSTG